jgi:hypothetical protein
MKIRPVGTELSHADGRAYGRTDRHTHTMKLVVAFRYFVKAPKKDKNTFDGVFSYLHGLSEFVLYRPANPLFGACTFVSPVSSV